MMEAGAGGSELDQKYPSSMYLLVLEIRLPVKFKG